MSTSGLNMTAVVNGPTDQLMLTDLAISSNEEGKYSRMPQGQEVAGPRALGFPAQHNLTRLDLQ